MIRNNLYAKFGISLSKLSKETGCKKTDIHKAILRAKNKLSLKDLTDMELSYLIQEIVAYLASECSIELYFNKEYSEDMERMNLKELFIYYNMLKTTKELPDGFFPVTDILSLKQVINDRLRGKNLYKDENLEASPQWVYVWEPSRQVFKPKYYWSGAPEEKIKELILKGLIYASR